jgi:hypothetical protein
LQEALQGLHVEPSQHFPPVGFTQAKALVRGGKTHRERLG